MSEKVISGYNWVLAVCLIAAFALLLGYALHADLTSEGLRRTQAFLVLGYLIYPLFYGGVAWILFFLVSLFVQRREFLRIADGSIRVKRRVVPFDNVSGVEVRRSWLGPKLLVLHRNEGSDIKLAAFALTRPVNEVAADLSAVLGHSNSTMT